MSNARSPREVCSTTIGTSGLTVLASFRFGRSNPSDTGSAQGPLTRPKTSNGLIRSTAGKPLFSVGCEPLLRRIDRLGGLGDEVQRLALGQVVLERVEAAVGL